MLKLRNLLVILIAMSMVCAVALAQEQDQEVFDLGEIVVTGTKTPQLLEDVPVQTRVVTREEIEKSGAQKIADILRNIPGIQISGGAPGAVASRSTPLLRGLPSHYTLVLLDGNRIRSEHMHTGFNLNLIPVDLVERIEIVEGPVSSLYGSDAVGGVINIITRAGSAKPGASLKLSGGNNKTYKGNSLVFFPIGNSMNMINYNHSESDGVNSQWFERDNIVLKTSISVTERKLLEFNYDYYEGDSYKGDDRKTNVAAQYTEEMKNDGRLTLKLAEQQYSNYKPTNNDVSTIQVQYTVPAGGNHLVTTGAEFREEDFERKNSPRNKQSTKSVFIQDEYYANDRWSLAAALRVDDFSLFGTEVNPNVSALYEVSKALRIRAAVARGFRAPSVQDLYEVHYDHGTYARDGNVNLKPEVAISYSLALEGSVTDSFLWRLSLYRDDFSNMIAVRDTGMVYSKTDGQDYAVCPVGHNCIPVRRRENVADAYSQGATAEIMASPLRNVTLKLGYSYLDTEDETTGRQLDYTPQNSYTVNLGYSVGRLNVSLRGEGATNRVYREVKTNNYIDMDNYFILGGNLSWTLRQDAELFFTIENILDEKYETFEEGKQPGQFARAYYIGAKYKF